MNSEDVKNTRLLLNRFNASALGEGDVNAGANVLAGMALSLCNLLRPDSVANSADGSRVSLGSSFLVTGALSSELVTDRVVSPLQFIQNNIHGHITQLGEVEGHRKATNENFGMNVLSGPGGPNREVDAILERIEETGFDHAKVSEIRKLLKPPVARMVSPIREQPILFATAAKPATVSELLKTAHAGRPFLHLVLRDQGDGRKFAQVASEVLDGCTMDDSVMRGVKGNWMVTDPEQIMCRPAETKEQGPGWLSRMLWLSDLSDGPDFGHGEGFKGASAFDLISSYDAAMEYVLVRRLDEYRFELNHVPTTIKFQGNQSEWIQYLRGVEPSLPGITATLRSLPASLFYGLVRMRGIFLKDAAAFAQWVLSFSRVLAARMIHAHRRVSEDRKEASLEATIRKLRERLTTFPQKEREFYRPIGIPANDCRRGLEVLADRGIATRDGDRWLRVTN
ncbi:MAG: hypothetical protein RLZZ214_2062 [Verrucomicrobiota bacterium]|jgi:hypothetical protein